VVAALAALAACSSAESADSGESSDQVTGREPPPAAFAPPKWEDGTTCGQTPEVQVYKYAPDTVVFRQSICTTFEAPFLYLVLGDKKAFLLDSGNRRDGAGAPVDVVTPVSAAITEWTAARQLSAEPELIVAHTHSHGDHVGGDRLFAARPNTKVIAYRPQQVATFFGLTQWPEGSAEFDLGNRVLDVVPIPGHEASHIAVYDRKAKFLFTGDTLYPGRLYIQDWAQYQASTQRLVQWVANNDVKVRLVLGAHIEMNTTPGQDYPFNAPQHVDEHSMLQPPERLREWSEAVQSIGPTPRLERKPDFILYPL